MAKENRMKWIYRLVDMPIVMPPYRLTTDNVEKCLNDLGLEGWELCGIEYGCFILKRQVRNDG